MRNNLVQQVVAVVQQTTRAPLRVSQEGPMEDGMIFLRHTAARAMLDMYNIVMITAGRLRSAAAPEHSCHG